MWLSLNNRYCLRKYKLPFRRSIERWRGYSLECRSRRSHSVVEGLEHRRHPQSTKHRPRTSNKPALWGLAREHWKDHSRRAALLTLPMPYPTRRTLYTARCDIFLVLDHIALGLFVQRVSVLFFRSPFSYFLDVYFICFLFTYFFTSLVFFSSSVPNICI